MRRLVSVVVAAAVACGLAIPITVAPAHAQSSASEATTFTAKLPGKLHKSGNRFTLPGDALSTKRVGNSVRGKVTLAEVAHFLGKHARQGRAVGGVVTLNDTSWPFKGAPVLLENGDVSVRVTQAGSSRARLNLRASGGSIQAVSCPPGQMPNMNPPMLQPTCMPIP